MALQFWAIWAVRAVKENFFGTVAAYLRAALGKEPHLPF